MAYREIVFEGTEEEVSQQWREARLHGVGGSDVAAIMGFSAFRSPYSVWAEKTRRTNPPDLTDNQAVEWGNRLEAVVRQKFADEHPELNVYETGAMFVSEERPWALANLDAIAEDQEGRKLVLEIKTAGHWMSDDWDDGVPDYYLTQVTHYMSVTGFDGAFVAVLIGGNDYREFFVERDEDDVMAVVQAVDRFWAENVEADEAPYFIGVKDESEILLDRDKYPSKELVELDSSTENRVRNTIKAIEYAKKRISGLDMEKKALENELKDLIGGARGISLTDSEGNSVNVTWSRYPKRKTDMKRLKADHAELIAAYEYVETTDGGLRINRPKNKKGE